MVLPAPGSVLSGRRWRKLKTDHVIQRLFHNWPAKILSLVVALILLVFHDITRLEERYVNAPLQIEQHHALVPASQWPRQVRVRLRGERDDIARVLDEDLDVVLDLQRFAREGLVMVPVEVRRSGSALEASTLEITVEPQAVELTLEERLVKSVEVLPRTSGFVPAGYQLIRSVMTPSAVEIEGPRSVVEPISTVFSEDVDISSRREDFTERIRLVSPSPLIRFRGGNVVEFRGVIDEAIVMETYNSIEIFMTGLDEELVLGQPLPQGSMRIQARQLDVENLAPGDIQLTVEASTIVEDGTFRLPVQPVVPPGFIVLRYEPTSVQVVIEGAE